MRRGISLIELIFTIVIIGVVFTVIPKIVLALNKSDEFAIKQDALFNGITITQMISRLSWDENSVNNNDVLKAGSNPFLECNATTHYRIGGFIGSRNCDEFNNTKQASDSLLFGLNDSNENSYSYFDDVDDFNAQSIDANTSNGKKYGLHVNVAYISDTIDYSFAQKAIINLTTSPTPTSNLKLIDVNVTYQGKRGEANTPITQFSYISSNIGKFFLAKRTW
jgi:hypothetical protein